MQFTSLYRETYHHLPALKASAPLQTQVLLQLAAAMTVRYLGLISASIIDSSLPFTLSLSLSLSRFLDIRILNSRVNAPSKLGSQRRKKSIGQVRIIVRLIVSSRLWSQLCEARGKRK